MMKSLRRRIIYALASTVTLYALAVVVSAQLAGCEAPPHVLRDRAADDPTQLRVMTLNVHYGSQPAASAEAISRGNADIICLQESTPAWEEYARTSLKDRYPHVIFHHEEYAGGMAVLSRYPLKELFYEQPPAGWFHGLGVTTQTPIGEMKLLDIHLRPPAKGRLGYLNYFRLSTIHPQEIEALHKKLAETESALPAIILGDFNEGDDGAAMKWLEKRNLADALGPFDSSTKTWHGKALGISFSERCDHILTPAQLKCVDAAVLKLGASDHYPVVAVMEKRGASSAAR